MKFKFNTKIKQIILESPITIEELSKLSQIFDLSQFDIKGEVTDSIKKIEQPEKEPNKPKNNIEHWLEQEIERQRKDKEQKEKYYRYRDHKPYSMILCETPNPEM